MRNPIWSSLIKFDQVWSSLDRSDPKKNSFIGESKIIGFDLADNFIEWNVSFFNLKNIGYKSKSGGVGDCIS